MSPWRPEQWSRGHRQTAAPDLAWVDATEFDPTDENVYLMLVPNGKPSLMNGSGAVVFLATIEGRDPLEAAAEATACRPTTSPTAWTPSSPTSCTVVSSCRGREKERVVRPSDSVRVPKVLLPKESVDLTRWAVIACDQFTSQPEYWARVESEVGDAPSTLRMVLPELHLGRPDVGQRVLACQAAMREYLASGILAPLEAMVHVERSHSGGVQQGLVVEVDLEAYDYASTARSPIRSTEGTVLDRLPPRMAVRRDAALELPHIMVLYDDPNGTVLAPVLAGRDGAEVLYDVELMLGSGHLTGRRVSGPVADEVLAALDALVEPAAYEGRYGLSADHPMAFAMGDGNHSLATAKAIWNELKGAGAASDHPARWALVELVNLHDSSLSFEPIHRVVFGAQGLVEALPGALGASLVPAASLEEVLGAVEVSDGVQRFGVVSADGWWVAEVERPTHQLAVGTLQAFLDGWVGSAGAEVDYVHGEDVTESLGRRPGNAGFLLPGIGKDAFFRSIAVDGPLPRKTFSMGHAQDKRFYMEARLIR